MQTTLRTTAQRLTLCVVCVVVGLVGLPSVGPLGDAGADFGAGQAARYNKNVNGDFLLVGNTVLKCSGNDCTDDNTTNDELNMVNNDPDGNGALFNGSSATFTIPAGSVVDGAFLYWGANLGTTRSNGQDYYCADGHDEASNATANKSDANKVKLKVGAGAYATLTADSAYTQPTGGLGQSLPTSSSADGLVYEGVKDVTSSFAAVPAATATSVSVADIQAMQGENCHAGWSLTVVYRFPALNCLTGAADNSGGGANRRNDYRNVAIYDGLLRQQDGAADSTTTLSGFLTAQPGPDDLRLGVVAWEGDQFLDEDQMKVKSNLSASATTVDPAGPSGTDNFFDSGKQTAADHNADLDANPDSGATIQRGFTSSRGDGHGIDAKTQVVQVPGGTSSIDVTFTTDSDQYYPGQFALSSPLTCLLILEKDQAVNGTSVPRDNSTSPAPFVKAGDVITYTVPVRVAGDVDVTDVTVTDNVPANTTYVAGSVKLGKGGTAAGALAALAAGGSQAAGTVTGNFGTLNNLTGGTCAAGEVCYGVLQFQVTVNAGVASGTVLTNTATATFSASGIPIVEGSNPVTDRVGALLTITKTITGAIAGDPTTFSFTVVCNGNQIAGSPVSLGNGGSVTLPVPTGASCSVTEATNANFAVTVSGAIATNGGSTTMTQDRSVAFTNTRQFGKVVVDKTATGVNGDPVAMPQFGFTVSCPGVAGYPKSLSVTGSGSAETPADIPFGTNCTVTETASPGWAQSASQNVQPLDESVEHVAFTNTRQTGSLIVTKTTVGGDGTFDFAVACDGTSWDVTRTITTSGGTGQSAAVTGIPSGVSCTVAETQQAGWTPTSAPAGAFTIVAGQQATASFTNTRQTSDLVITKAVSGTYALPVSGSFDFVVNCGAAGTFNRTIVASNTTNGTATVAGLPVGTSCTVTETAPSGWALDASIGGNTNGRVVVIASQGNAVTFTNRHDVGTITVQKTIDQGSGTFHFTLTCGGTPLPGTPVDITIDAPATTGSATVANIPTGSSCIVDEDPNGSVAGDFVQVTPADDGNVTFASTGATQTASFVDHRRVGDLVIRKQFPQGSLGDPDRVFTFEWDCGPQPRTIGLKAGEQHTVSGIPTGTSCTVSEVADADYTTTVTPDGGAVDIDEGTNTVTFTNTRKTATLQVKKVLEPADDPGRFDLIVDGDTEKAGAGNGDQTAEITLPIGPHGIAEAVTAGNGASLSDYTATVACVDTSAESSVPVTLDGNVVLTEGAGVVCTFTNARKTGNLTLVKEVVDPLQGTDTFDLLAGDVTVVADAVDGSSGSTVAETGTVTVSETGTNLDAYRSAIECTSGDDVVASGDGTSLDVTVTGGADITCTFTNTRRTGTLEVRKLLTPADDTGTFDLLIDGVVRKAAAGHNGTTGAVVVAPGTHTVVEEPTPGTSTEYGSTLSCVDTSNENDEVAVEGGELEVGEGQTVLCTFTNTRQGPDLGILKSASAPYVLPGGEVTFTVQVTNIGGGTAHDVVVSDPLPDGVEYVSSEGDVCSVTGTSCDLGDLGPGDATSFTITYEVDADPGVTVVHNAVTVTSTEDPTSPGDDADVPIASMAIAKVVTSTGPYALGATITYSITVTNTGGATLHGVHIDDAGTGAVLDPACAAAPDGAGVTLAPAATVSCTATHTVTQADFDEGSYTNVAVGSSDETPDVDDTVTVPTPDPAVDLAIVKALTSSSLVAGQQATYTLTVSNNGPATATSITVTDTMPAGLTAVSATGSSWACTTVSGTITCTTASALVSGGTLPAITVTVAVSASATGTITNTGAVSGTQPDRDPSNNSSSVTSPLTAVLAATTVPTTTTTVATTTTRVTTTTAAVAVQRASTTRQTSGSPLATTGTTVSLLVLIAGVLMVLGAGLLAVLRTRRAGSAPTMP